MFPTIDDSKWLSNIESTHWLDHIKVSDIWALTQEKLSLSFANNKGILISSLDICFLGSIISKLATGKISFFLASLCS